MTAHYHRSLTLLLLTCTFTCAAVLPPTPAHAVELNFGGLIQSDIRFRPQEKQAGPFYTGLTLPAGVERNQNFLKLKMDATAGRFAGVAEVDFVWHGFMAAPESVGELYYPDRVSPYYLKVHALYLEAMDLGLQGLDLRVGQQLVQWGKSDQFNPTNVINPNDMQDILLFGQQAANLMVRMDYTFKETWSLSGVLVPIFKPSILPNTAPLGLASSDRLPFVDDDLRRRILAEQSLTGGVLAEMGMDDMVYPTMVSKAIPVLPETSLANMQFAFRVAGVLADQDIAINYYNGRSDMPQPFFNFTTMNKGRLCNPINPAECIAGTLSTETTLAYPKFQQVGLNLAGQINPLKWLTSKAKSWGYRFELGVFFPQRASIALYQDELDFGLLKQPAGEYEYFTGYTLGGQRPAVMESTPFAKWSLGLDYNFNEHLYLNVQWVHGLVDEFGAGGLFSSGWAMRKGDITSNAGETIACYMAQSGEQCARELLMPRIADYLVLGVDVKLMSDRLLLRLFTILYLNGVFEEYWDPNQQERVQDHHSMFSAKGFSAVIFPELLYNFGHGFELGAGALFQLGEDHTKFGDPAAGGSLIWTRARFSY